MPFIDLPAQNTGGVPSVNNRSAERVGGLGCWATPGEASGYVRFNLNAGKKRIYVGKDDLHENVMGFGLWTQPPGAVVTDIRFVAEGRISAATATDDAQWADVYGPSVTHYPIGNYPFPFIRYNDDPFAPNDGGYHISSFPVGNTPEEELCEVTLKHVLATVASGTADYVIAGTGTPDTGLNGLCPEIYLQLQPDASPNGADLLISYMAVRITYAEAAIVGRPLDAIRIFSPPTR